MTDHSFSSPLSGQGSSAIKTLLLKGPTDLGNDFISHEQQLFTPCTLIGNGVQFLILTGTSKDPSIAVSSIRELAMEGSMNSSKPVITTRDIDIPKSANPFVKDLITQLTLRRRM